MSARTVNWSLYFVTFVLLATGAAILPTNRADLGWLVEAHRYAGALLCLLLIPKFGIIARAYARRLKRGTWNEWNTWAGLVLTVLLLFVTFLALGWTLNVTPFWIQVILSITPIELHWYLAFALVPFFLWHVWARWLVPPKFAQLPHELVSSTRTRRQALALIGTSTLGVVAWGALELGANLSGWQRRFTGSRLIAEFTANDFPVTASDAEPAIDIANWQLQVRGNVPQAYTLTYAQLIDMGAEERTATLDCTLGWAATQHWRGVALGALLARAGWNGQAPMLVYATTGAVVTLGAEDIAETILATHIDDAPLSPEHGYPARLVIPSRRGFHWLKWVSQIVVT